MTITPNTVVVGAPPRISALGFKAALDVALSPARGEALDAYAAIVAQGVDPCFLLAVFRKESQYGTDPKSIVFNFNTCNPGNCRSSTIGSMPLITTSRGIFVKYPDWLTGFKDMAHRLIDRSYVYAQEGRETIAQVIERWAPKGDLDNDPAKYLETVVSLMNQWTTGGGGGRKMFDLNNIPFRQSPNFDVGGNSCKKIVCHSTEGGYNSSVSWLLSPAAQASAHYVINEDGSECTQLVKDGDIAWHAGNMTYNRMCIGIEHSWFSDGRNGPPPDSLYQAGAKLAAKLCKKYGITPNRGNIIAHGEVPPPNDHVDPGPRWDWPKFMAYVTQAYQGGLNHVTNDITNSSQIPAPTSAPAPQEPPVIYVPETGKSIGYGFKSFWQGLDRLGDNYRLLLMGYPVTNEFDFYFQSDPTKKRVVQLFERSGMVYEAENAPPWDNHFMTVGQLMEVYQYALDNSLLAPGAALTPFSKAEIQSGNQAAFAEVIQSSLETWAKAGITADQLKQLDLMMTAWRAGKSYEEYKATA